MEIYLHHYPASLFSEKIRAMLGFHGLAWHSVVTASVMPRPLLMPLTGGYRKTPNLQIGANVYCDTAAIARGLARHTGDATLFASGFNADRVAEWADSQLFRVTVALNFRPEALGAMMSQFSEDEVAEFMADRAKLTEGAAISTFSPAAALAYIEHYLDALEAGFEGDFLFGQAPTIADFSLYHCLWFLRANPVNAQLLEGYARTDEWLARMAAFGHGEVVESTAEAALGYARESEPVDPGLTSRYPDGFTAGDLVHVMPVDYGRIPVVGELAGWTSDEIVIARDDPEAGSVMVHFPNAGFEVTREG